MGHCVTSLVASGVRDATVVHACDDFDCSSNVWRGTADGVHRASVVPVLAARVELVAQWRGRECLLVSTADATSRRDPDGQALAAWRDLHGREPTFVTPGRLPPLPPSSIHVRQLGTLLKNLWPPRLGSGTAPTSARAPDSLQRTA